MRSIALKLTLSFLLVALTGAILIGFLVDLRTKSAFDRFVTDRTTERLVRSATRHYQKYQSWDNVEDVFYDGPFFSSGHRDKDHWDLPFMWAALVNVNKIVVFSEDQDKMGQKLTNDQLELGIPLRVRNKLVGWLLPEGIKDELESAPDLNDRSAQTNEKSAQTNEWEDGSPESEFIDDVKHAIGLSVFGGTALALLLGILLTRTFTRPIHELTKATEAVAKGEFGHQVTVHSKDELGKLAISFNKMSADLAHAQHLRQQMTADIAHDLRTPLSLILAYTEALSDGKLPGSQDIFEVMHHEAQHLNHLIDDLRTLSLADAGELPLNRLQLPPQELLERTAAAYSAQAQQQEIALEVEVSPNLSEIEVDPERIAQVLGNLVSNALRYTSAGGHIRLTAETSLEGTILCVEDNGTGIAPEDQPYIFERFYRADKSREQNGESGLGLAIAKSIIEAHGGTISLESTINEGSIFKIVF